MPKASLKAKEEKPTPVEVGAGYLPDLPSDDPIYAAGVGTVVAPPREYDLRIVHGYDPKILWQNSTNMCLGGAWKYYIQYLSHRVNRNEGHLELSGTFIYYFARALVGMEKQDLGSYPRMAAQVLEEYGVPLASLTPEYKNGRPDVVTKPNAKAIEAAARHKIKGVQRVTHEMVKSCISRDKPVVVGIRTSLNALTDGFSSGTIRLPGSFESKVGHALCIMGYDEFSFFGPHTYGDQFGSDGWFRLPAAYITPEYCRDLWTADTVVYDGVEMRV